MDSDELLERVRAIPGVMEARIMHGRQCDRLYVKVATGDGLPCREPEDLAGRSPDF